MVLTLPKDLTQRIATDKLLREKVFNVAKNPKDDGYRSWHASVVYKFFE